jgi:hypothetical protein
MRVKLHSFFTSVLDRDEWPIQRRGKKSSLLDELGGWMDLRAGLGALKKRTTLVTLLGKDA